MKLSCFYETLGVGIKTMAMICIAFQLTPQLLKVSEFNLSWVIKNMTFYFFFCKKNHIMVSPGLPVMYSTW